MNARELLQDYGRQLGLEPATLNRIFDGAPTDFGVSFGERLPLFAHVAGMAGITLFGRVYLLHATRRYSPVGMICLLRHEAEHVRQQREDPFFLLRYGIGWLRAMAREIVGVLTGPNRQLAGISARAYRAIEAEREAYAADLTARRILLEGR